MLSSEADVEKLWERLTDGGLGNDTLPLVQVYLLKEILLQLVELNSASAKAMEPLLEGTQKMVESYRVAMVEYRETLDRFSGR